MDKSAVMSEPSCMTRPAPHSGETHSGADARLALLRSFGELVLTRRYADFGVNSVIRAAQVARSTFYYHFSGKDDLLLANLQPFAKALASTLESRSVSPELEQWVAHIWQHRGTARRLFAGRTGEKIHAMLVDHFQESLRTGPATRRQETIPMLAEQIAGAMGALLRGWVEHRFSASAVCLAQSLHHCATALAGDDPALSPARS